MTKSRFGAERRRERPRLIVFFERLCFLALLCLRLVGCFPNFSSSSADLKFLSSNFSI